MYSCTSCLCIRYRYQSSDLTQPHKPIWMISLVISTVPILCLHNMQWVYFPQFGEFDSPCIPSAVCPVSLLWTTCTQRSWTGRGCRRLCQRSLGSGRAGREICNTRTDTSCIGSNPWLLPASESSQNDTAFIIMLCH